MTTALDQLSTDLVRSRSTQLKSLRSLVMSQLYPTLPPFETLDQAERSGASPSGLRDPLVTLANTFTRYAQTQTTYVDELGTSRSNGNGSGNVLERQVSRAIAQVLGKAPGNSPDSFISALNGAFPTMTNGKISSNPSRSAVSLYGQINNGYSQPGAVYEQGGYTQTASAGLMGQISSEQATLYRQATVVATDALKVLAGLQSFVPQAETDKVEALRSLIQSEINSLMEEFGRVDEPRKQRVETYLRQLRDHLNQLGERAFLDRRRSRVVPTTLEDEAQVAGYELLVKYVKILREIWNNYKPSTQSIDFPLFSERLSRASVLLSVIAEGNANFMSALDSIGFTESERRSSASKFTTLGDGDPKLPDMTVSDLTNWIDSFASLDGPRYLADSGQYGLDFVTHQADSIFWVFTPIRAFTISAMSLSLSSMPILAQALTHERVSWTVDDLVNQLNALAGLMN